MRNDAKQEALDLVTEMRNHFQEEGDKKNEGNALCMLSEAHGRKKEYKMAVKAAERARAVFKELGEAEGEAAALYRMAANSTQQAVQEGARVVQKEPLTRSAKDALDKGAKAADTAARYARQLLAK